MEWKTTPGLTPYEDAVAFMERRVAAIRAGNAQECVWLLEHPPLYTAGTSAKAADLLDKQRFPVYQSGRGGEYTYHGPGQRIAYVMLDLKQRHNGHPDVRRYVRQLEEWIIRALSDYGVQGERRDGRVGIWVIDPASGGEKKIAALGIRIRKFVTYHGIAINISPDISHFSGIIPCGIKEFGVTSLKMLGKSVTTEELDGSLARHFSGIF